MPVNVEDPEAYEQLLFAIVDRLVSVHVASFERVIDMFWKRLVMLPVNSRIVDVAGEELEDSLRVLLVNLHVDASERFINSTLAIASDASEKAFFPSLTRDFPSLTRKTAADDARNAIADHIQRVGLDNAQSINNSMRDYARRLIARGIRDGKTLDQIADELATNRRIISRRRVRALRTTPRQQAELIVRNEVYNAQAYATQAAVVASGLDITRKVWIQVQRKTKRASHAELHRRRIKMDEEFLVGGHRALFPRDGRLPPGEVINCFTGDTPVVPSNVKHVYRHWYEGEFITIETAQGRKLIGTPNHPIVTTEGFVPLGEINESHDIFAASINGEAVGGFRPQIKDVQVPIEQVFDATHGVGRIDRISGCHVNLHGYVPEEHIDVVATDCGLWNGVDPALFEPVDQIEFALANLAKRFGLRKRFDKNFVKLGDAHSSRSCGVSNVSAGKVGVDRCIKIVRSVSSQYVYSLETVSGLFLAQGLVTRNCDCHLIYVERGARGPSARQGVDGEHVYRPY